MLVINHRIQIPESEFEWSFARSSGSGGQNVNKVNSKAVLKWRPLTSAGLPEDVKMRFVEKFSQRLTREGDLILQSDRFRDQPRNIADCLQKLTALLLTVAVAPKKRRATKPSYSSKQKRLEKKRHHSQKKKSRKISMDD